MFSGSYSTSIGLGDCSSNGFVNNNAGCGVRTNGFNSFGLAFNENGGGWCVEDP
jgi:hypothetical protein